ncbi:MAG: META domain-containing protein [Parvularculaceae bacterium]
MNIRLLIISAAALGAAACAHAAADDAQPAAQADAAAAGLVADADTGCAEEMSGAPVPKSQNPEEEGGAALNGCAGEPADLLTGDEWLVEDIGGRGVVDIARTTMQFGEDGRLTGGGACNRYGAPYTITGEGLSFGRAISTRKACPPAIMDQENKFFDALAAIDRFEIDETGALLLYGGGERLLLARR